MILLSAVDLSFRSLPEQSMKYAQSTVKEIQEKAENISNEMAKKRRRINQ
jgi:hypothetical protein